jgi:RimJ/RimL family protein N-acetyltransferase
LYIWLSPSGGGAGGGTEVIKIIYAATTNAYKNIQTLFTLIRWERVRSLFIWLSPSGRGAGGGTEVIKIIYAATTNAYKNIQTLFTSHSMGED